MKDNNVDLSVLCIPPSLRLRMRHPEALQRAVEEGFIVMVEGHLHWTSDNKTQLAYFCGRLFCGDYSCPCKRKAGHVWKHQAGIGFPARELELLFGVPLLGQIRRNQKNMRISDVTQVVDLLFAEGRSVTGA